MRNEALNSAILNFLKDEELLKAIMDTAKANAAMERMERILQARYSRRLW